MKSVKGLSLLAPLAFGGALGCQPPDPGVPGDSPTVTTEPTPVDSSSGDASGTSSGSGTEPGVGQSLVLPESWALATSEDDPFTDERPVEVGCSLGWGVETGAFEVNTEICLYGAFVQPTLAEIHQGDTLELVLLHDALYATRPAEAHLAIAFGEELSWETRLPIPSEAGLVRPMWTAMEDVPLGTPVHFHVHNHGVNNYRLIDVTVSP